jgi:cysteine desulfurase / selenocysteine lyase
MSLDAATVRRQFHFFRSHPDAIYFDNASTTQKPDRVLQAMDPCWTCSANVGRSAHSLASRMTRGVETTRERVAAFLGASSPSELVFTSGATHSLNLAALSWGLVNLRDGDEILYCPHDHKSAVLPWMNLRDILQRFGVHIRLVPFGVTFAGDGDIDDLLAKVTPRTRAIALTHIHNAYGTKTDVERVRPAVGPDMVISLDAAQSVGHIGV